MKRTRAVLSALMPIAVAGSASAAPLQRTTVFQSGQNGYHTFRIPSIIHAANGDLLAFAEGRKHSTSDTGDIDLVMRRSTDGGVTWGSLSLIADDGFNTVGNPSPVVDRSTGNIILVTTRNLGQDSQTEISSGTSDGTRTVWVQRSTNNGMSWTTPSEITSSVKAAGSRWYATGPSHAIQLERGAHAGRLVFGANQSGPANNGALIFYSDDGGTTFIQGGNIYSSGSVNPSESSVVELVDGVININSRNRGGTTRSRAVAYSNNGGGSFYGASQASALIDPIVQGSILRYGAVDRGDAQNRILFSNPADPTLRKRMTIRISFDETMTWSAGKLIDRGSAAYSDMVSVGDGSGGVLYEQDNYSRIEYAGWSAGWLDDPTILQLDFAESSGGAASSAAGVIRDSRGYGLHATAESGPTYVAGDPRYRNGSALRFTQGSDGVRIADPLNDMLDFEAIDSFTLEAVFRTTSHGDASANESGPLISKDVAPGSASYWLRIQGGEVRFLVSDGTREPNVTSGVAVNDGAWHHMAAQRDADSRSLRIYLDYQLVATTADTTTGSFANTNDLLVGAFNSAAAGTKQFIGDIDFVRVSSGALAIGDFYQPPVSSVWNVDSGGNWTTAGNWSSGVPSGIDHTSIFGDAISAARTVTLDSARTVGTLTFDSLNEYTIASTNRMLTFDVTTGTAGINVVRGNHVIAAGVHLMDDMVIDVVPPGSVLTLSGPVSSAGQTVLKAGDGTVQFQNIRAAKLFLSSGTVKILSKPTQFGPAGTSILASLSITSGAVLNLTNNSMAIQYGVDAFTALSDVRDHLSAGRITGESGSEQLVLGYVDNSILNRATFDGVAVSAESILIGLTLRGDTNLDRTVNFEDLLTLAQSYGAASEATWGNGDSDYDGAVAFSDLLAIAQNYGQSVLIDGTVAGRLFDSFEMDWVLAQSIVPEPVLSVFLVLPLAAGRRRRGGQCARV